MQQENTAPSQEAAEEVKKQAKNFAELRSKWESASQENNQLKQKMSQLEQMISDLQSRPAPQDDEPYVDASRLQREMTSLKESLSKEIDKKAEEKARLLLMQERQSDYINQNKDFYDVLQENEIKDFVAKYPNLAAPLARMPDGFEKQQLAYELMKTVKTVKPANPEPPVQKSMLAQAFEQRKAAMAYQPGGSSGGAFQSMGDFSPGGMKQAYDRFKSLQKTVNL